MVSSNEKECILVVDDAPDTLEVLQRNLTSEGYKVFTAPGVPEAIEILETTMIDLVITDLKMPKVSGLDLIRHIRENFKNTEVMMITGYSTVKGAVSAMKTGAEEYLPKPFTDEELLSAVTRVLNKLHEQRIVQEQAHKKTFATHDIIGESKAISRVLDSITKAASTSATVLLSGESGTGKELVAREIHYNSPRASAPFIAINCGGIPENLIESELFGYVKGAFTGATTSRAGFFQTADGGTIFLDEISETSPSMQVKLLRVLQDKEFCMVGANKTHKVDVRILAATNKDLHSLVTKGVFREDLFFRLNVIDITIPPLRKRGDDILLFIHHFASQFAGEHNKPIPKFSEKALQVLKSYNWPGNVRELENVIQRLVVMTDDDFIEIYDLPSLMRFSALSSIGFDRTLAEVEAEYIRNVLASMNGNKTKAAQVLGINRKTLREKLKKQELLSL
ncbi:MAG: sigma 54 response regulator [Candidatus Scalindua rubra]|uniref:Sigma 54 response regulator n=1 Tax=Candidatus Scalindua rubra TaxID=1872076 RepID=A0A1E3X606_9BACT|nr:MAG: sigma 54 response regulator [Candidatus Scalindua rubra]